MGEFRFSLPRVPLYGMPDAVILTAVRAAKNDPNYAAAKGGDPLQAAALIENLVGLDQIDLVRRLLDGRQPIVSPIHALETAGFNEIPLALAVALAHALTLQIETSVIQLSTAGHTGASGWHRLANPAIFGGDVTRDAEYLLVDDFIGQGGTVANLAGFIRSKGGEVLGVTTLTGQTRSARLGPDQRLIDSLREKHGENLEDWWKERFGYGFDCLTYSEARYLERVEDADTVRARIIEARQGEVLPDTSGEAESGIT
jgi:hypothetical protein